MAKIHDLPEWAAIELDGSELPAGIPYQRAVWGKMHGAGSEFRFIARSAGLNETAEIQTGLGLGSEDAPAPGCAWRSFGDFHCSIGFYPSRSRDPAGRAGFLEKQILLWRRPPGFPATLGAFRLLELARQADDGIWWGRHEDPRLYDPDFSFELPAEMPLAIDFASLAGEMDGGRRRLVEQVGENGLALAYARILAGNRSVPLEVDAALPPNALAAFLLPLPRRIADRLSLAGWLPANRVSSDDLARDWDIVAGPPIGLAPVGSPPDKPQLQMGARLAEAIAIGRPPRNAMPPDAAPSAEPAGDVHIALWGPVAAGKTVLLAQLYLGRSEESATGGWEVFPTQESLKFGSDMRELVTRHNRFPTATPISLTERLVYRFHHPARGDRASLVVEDRAGGYSERLDDHARERLSSAQGLVLIFDPKSDVGKFQMEIEQTLDEVHLARQGDVYKDTRPIAACISKADLLIQTTEDARFASSEPDAFVRQRVRAAPILIEALKRFSKNFRLFPVSAIGLRLQHGAVEPTVFYDECFDLRLRSQSRPFNLIAPFAWVLDQVTGR